MKEGINRMTTFEIINQDLIEGKITGFDRLIFKGHLTNFYPKNAFSYFLNQQGVLLKDFKKFVTGVTEEIKNHIEKVAETAKCQNIYFQTAMTKKNGKSKKDVALEIAEKEGITEGLIGIFRALEVCNSFQVKGNRQTKKLEIVPSRTKCLHYYFYYQHPTFGLMHIRLQSWFPFTVQIHINGRLWLEKKLQAENLSYEMYENSFTQVEDIEKTQKLSDEMSHFKFPEIFDGLLDKINPWLPKLKQMGYSGYLWCVDQAEIATDIMFKDRETLKELTPTLFQETVLNCSAEDVMKFLGRKFHGNFKGEIISDLKKRPEGWRAKHYLQKNHIKMYDKYNVLRIETTINNPREFKIFKTVTDKNGKTSQRWMPMGKSVANLYRYFQVGTQSNQRYLVALAQFQPQSKQIKELDLLCQSTKGKNGKHVAKLNPITEKDCNIFSAVMSGEFIINGFRNKHLVKKLFQKADPHLEKRYRERVSRLLSKLVGHGLISRVRNSRLYRVTKKGFSVMAAALRYRNKDFPILLSEFRAALV